MLGGFIWDWLDQGLLETDVDGRVYWGYGGDYERPDDHNDGNFLINGLLNPDRTPKPAMWTCKYVFQPYEFRLTDNNVLVIRNRKFHTTSSDSRFFWELKEDGKVLQSGELAVPQIEAGTEAEVVVPVKKFRRKSGSVYMIDVRAEENGVRLYADAGHINSREQFIIETVADDKALPAQDKVKIKDGNGNITIYAGTSEITVDENSGFIVNYTSKGNTLISSALKPHFWRAQTDNDRRGWRTMEKLGFWRDIDDRYTYAEVAIEDNATVSVIKCAGEDVVVTLKYRFFNDGSAIVDFNLGLGENVPEPLRVGMQTQVPSECRNVTYFGYGECENYPDRVAGSFLDVYRTSAENMGFDYVMPQENGNRTGVRWIALTPDKGTGVMFTSGTDEHLNASVWPYSEAALEAAKHINKLDAEDNVTLNIDYKIAGVGGIDSWSSKAAPIEEYRLLEKEYTYSFTISPAYSSNLKTR